MSDSIGEVALSHSMQFASLTAKVVDELLKLLDELIINHTKKNALQQFIEGNGGLEELTHFDSGVLDAAAISAKLKEADIDHQVIFKQSRIEKDGMIVSQGKFVIKNEDINRVKNSIIALGREVTGCNNIPLDELAKKAEKTNSKIYKINNISYAEKAAIALLAKKAGRPFMYSATQADDNTFSIYCSERDAKKLNLALMQISLNKDFYDNEVIVDGKNIEKEKEITKSIIDKAIDGESFSVFGGINKSLEVRVSNNNFVVYENNKALYSPPKQLYEDDKQKYYTELLTHVESLTYPVMLSEKERNTEDYREILNEKVSEKYSNVEPLPDTLKDSVARISNMAINDAALNNNIDITNLEVFKGMIAQQIEENEIKSAIENINIDKFSAEFASQEEIDASRDLFDSISFTNDSFKENEHNRGDVHEYE